MEDFGLTPTQKRYLKNVQIEHEKALQCWGIKDAEYSTYISNSMDSIRSVSLNSISTLIE